jgi:hypothetical protein
MQHWHRPGPDGAAAGRQPAALGQVAPRAELGDKFRQLEEVVAVVSVPHNHEGAACRRNPATQCIAVAPGSHVHDVGTHAPGDVLRAISAPVICNDDLAVDVMVAERPLRLADAHSESVRLVQARHDDRDFDVGFRWGGLDE